MSVVEQIIDFFKGIFSPNDPENIKKQELRKLESQLHDLNFSSYRRGMVLPTFGQAFFLLYKNTSTIERITRFMYSGEEQRLKERLQGLLIETGFPVKIAEVFNSLSYERRKERLLAAASQKRELELQHQEMTEVLKALQHSSFQEIEAVVKNLELFHNLCSYNFIAGLKKFNSSFDALSPDTAFHEVAIGVLEEALLDLYFITANIKITASLGRALFAIAENIPETRGKYSVDGILDDLKKIRGLLSKFFSARILLFLIRIAKKDPSFEPDVFVNDAKIIEDYGVKLKNRFDADEQRLNLEIQDIQLSREIRDVFGDIRLVELNGYSEENNKILHSGAAFAFLWIRPLQIIKTFLRVYFTESVQAFLNDVILEGFFNHPEHKSEFAKVVFSCVDIEKQFAEFEQSFGRSKKNDIALLLGYVKDSRKDAEFLRNLKTMVLTINNSAKVLVQEFSEHLFNLYKLLLQLIEDSKKSKPDSITNVKVLFTSSRNRDSVEFLEKSIVQWAGFLNIMKTYAVIGLIENPREEMRQV